MSSNQIVVKDDRVALFDTGRFEHMQRISAAMAASTLVPEIFQGQQANCLMVCQQADRWGMDPFALAQCAYVTKGKLGYEGKLIAAVINARARLKRRLCFDLAGSGQAMSITVSGTFCDEDEPRIVQATWAEGRKMSQGGAKWAELPDQMLCYYGARKWARRHAPELMLGILSDDELPPQAGAMRDITPVSQERPPAHQIEDLDGLVSYYTAPAEPAADDWLPDDDPAGLEPIDHDPETGEVIDGKLEDTEPPEQINPPFTIVFDEAGRSLAFPKRSEAYKALFEAIVEGDSQFQAARLLHWNRGFVKPLPAAKRTELATLQHDLKERDREQGELLAGGRL